MKDELILNNDNIKKALEFFGFDTVENPFLTKGTPSKEETNNELELLEKGLKETQDKIAALKGTNTPAAENNLSKALGVKEYDTLVKGLQAIDKLSVAALRLGQENKQLKEQNAKLQKGLDNLSKLPSSVDELKKGLDTISDLKERLEKIENTPLVKGTKIADHIPSGKDDLQKGLTEEKEGKNILSQAKDRGKIKALLTTKVDEDLQKGLTLENSDYMKNALAFDAGSPLTSTVIGLLQKEGYQITT